MPTPISAACSRLSLIRSPQRKPTKEILYGKAASTRFLLVGNYTVTASDDSRQPFYCEKDIVFGKYFIRPFCHAESDRIVLGRKAYFPKKKKYPRTVEGRRQERFRDAAERHAIAQRLATSTISFAKKSDTRFQNTPTDNISTDILADALKDAGLNPFKGKRILHYRRTYLRPDA